MESVRLFFHSHHTQLRGIEWETAYHGYANGEEVEDMMVSLWLSAIQRELGSPIDIRHPPTPSVSFICTDSNGYGTDEPNDFWLSPSEPFDTSLKANGPPLPFHGQDSIEWEEALNIGTLARMQEIHQRLVKRLDAHYAKKKRIPHVTFLNSLATAVKHWLREVEEKGKAVENEVDAQRLPGAFPLRDSAVFNGRKLCHVLIQNIRRYEVSWKEALDADKDLDSIPAPCLTKDILASVIRQCPIIQTGDRASYCHKWLLENVGNRFFAKRAHHGKNKTGILRLAHLGIRKDDLGCTSEVWSLIQPGGGCQKPLGSVQYFAPIPLLMRARNALGRWSVAEDRMKIQGRDDIWLALNSLPPSFLTFITKKQPSFADQVLDLMIKKPSGADKVEFFRDWNKALSNSRLVLPGKPKGNLPTQRRRKNIAHDLNGDDQDMVNDYTDITGEVLDRWYCRDLVSRLAHDDRTRPPYENKNILTAEDVMSVLPGKQMTCRALYRFIGATLLQNNSADVVPPSLVEQWNRNRKDKDILSSLAASFEVVAGTAVKTVFILTPLTKYAEALAICSLSSASCSTLLIGRDKATAAMEAFLRALYKRIFPGPFEFSSERFHQLPIRIGTEISQQKWACNNYEDVGIVLTGAVIDASWVGRRGIGELLGLGRVSEKTLGIPFIRMQCLRTLKSSNSAKRDSGLSLPLGNFIDPDDSDGSDDVDLLDHSTDEDDSDSDSSTDEVGSVHFDHHPVLETTSEQLSIDPDDQEQEELNTNEWLLDLDKIAENMAEIDMDDPKKVEKRIAAALQSADRERFTLTLEDETRVISLVLGDDSSCKSLRLVFCESG